MTDTIKFIESGKITFHSPSRKALKYWKGSWISIENKEPYSIWFQGYRVKPGKCRVVPMKARWWWLLYRDIKNFILNLRIKK